MFERWNTLDHEICSPYVPQPFKVLCIKSGIPFFLELSVGPAVVSPPFSWRRLIGV